VKKGDTIYVFSLYRNRCFALEVREINYNSPDDNLPPDSVVVRYEDGEERTLLRSVHIWHENEFDAYMEMCNYWEQEQDKARRMYNNASFIIAKKFPEEVKRYNEKVLEEMYKK